MAWRSSGCHQSLQWRENFSDARRREQHLEDVRLWKERNPERARAIRKRGSARWLARVLREEACVACGLRFGWTNAHEQRRRRRGQAVVCSIRCGIAARRRLRTADIESARGDEG